MTTFLYTAKKWACSIEDPLHSNILMFTNLFTNILPSYFCCILDQLRVNDKLDCKLTVTIGCRDILMFSFYEFADTTVLPNGELSTQSLY